MATSMHARDWYQLSAVRDRRVEESPSLRAPSRAARRFAGISGQSAALTSVLTQSVRVAPTDAPVLIQGETGTGKEHLAHALHRLSARCTHNCVARNGAAIPLGLLDSERFGCETRVPGEDGYFSPVLGPPKLTFARGSIRTFICMSGHKDVNAHKATRPSCSPVSGLRQAMLTVTGPC